ncbi:alpha/beta-hydrolase [Aspergillus udagawae]|uniref:Alpha/beta-hydrolase n=1 Tax=Aspergillus udagawae TaxID=91492 RepID=A0A8H3RKH2_9EURO|nr:alpha/beta-hydrolase [Aspergillus udagawae]
MASSLLSSLAFLITATIVIANPTVTISSGVVIGTTVTPVNQPSATAVVNAFLGIPFAKSPPQRFSPPEAPEPWSTPLQAQSLAPSCPQQNISVNGLSLERQLALPVAGDIQQSEDCLYLNVYAPQNSSSSNLTEVLFWIHGGDLIGGSASQSLYTASPLPINENIVLVIPNYRLSMFGFSNSPEIPSGQQNSGFLDQRLALNWTQNNIKQFGGDPSKVTVFSESAGGWSAKQLLAIPPSPLPFQAAIIESEALELPGNGTANYQNVSQHFNCTDISCLRNVSMSSIQDYVSKNNLFFKPVADNATSVSDIRNSINNGTFANVSMIIGTNKNELSQLVFLISGGGTFNVNQTLDNICAAIHIQKPLCNLFIGQLQKLVGGNLTWPDISRIVTDTVFTCPTGAIANYTSGHGLKVWRYRYSASLNDTGTFPGEGAVHASEVPIVFGTYPTENATDQEVALSKYMQHAWASFAKNPDGGPGWPQIGTNGGLELADIGSGNSSGENNVTFWEADSYCGTLLGYAEQLGFAW